VVKFFVQIIAPVIGLFGILQALFPANTRRQKAGWIALFISLTLISIVLLVIPRPMPLGTTTPMPFAWWKLNSVSGTIAVDSAGSNNGTLNSGASFVTGGILGGYAASLGKSAWNGGGNVRLPVNLPASFTLYFWINPASYNSADPGSGDGNSAFGGEVYKISGFRTGFRPNGIFEFWTVESGGTIGLNDTASTPTGTWTQFAITFDHNVSTASLYRNGTLIATSSGSYIPSATPMGVDYGVDAVGYFYGLVDQVRLYDHPLSGAAITALYKSDLKP